MEGGVLFLSIVWSVGAILLMFLPKMLIDKRRCRAIGMMTRTFHPVGQGAFYSEEFKDEEGEVRFRIVYDCGSLKSCGLQPRSDGQPFRRSDVEDRVEKAFSDEDVIDLLFISHFDDDHVNLISCLTPFKKHHIRKVVLPLLSEKERCLLTGYYLLSDEVREDAGQNETLIRLINAPREFFGASEDVVFVRPHGGDDVDERRAREPISFEDLSGEVPSLVEIDISKQMGAKGLSGCWVFVPYNHKPERYAELQDSLKRAFEDANIKFKLEDLKDIDFVVQNLKVLRECYNGLIDGINRNSMALYSGPARHSDIRFALEDKVGARDYWIGCYLRQLSIWCVRCAVLAARPFVVEEPSKFLNCPGCLYTGDIALRDAGLSTRFQSYTDNIGMVQLPHHGSQDSFQGGDLPIEGRVCVATYGEKNKFGHPALVVKRAVSDRDGFWTDVTELEESRFKVSYVRKK